MCGSNQSPRTRCRLVLSVLAVLYGTDGWKYIELIGKIQLSRLRKLIKLDNSVRSHDTISRIFRVIKPSAFQDAFLAWLNGLDLSNESFNLVAIVGKAIVSDDGR